MKNQIFKYSHSSSREWRFGEKNSTQVGSRFRIKTHAKQIKGWRRVLPRALPVGVRASVERETAAICVLCTGRESIVRPSGRSHSSREMNSSPHVIDLRRDALLLLENNRP
ncbi:hypothetical protein AVEN_85416-1 [Araneus ventricosus]|uniref:Uncharacterized protein n=1 Tax=Araneus ventricosus TaxID=182803 RepID=A0A4Y2FFS5_ARAVE|nr:hypothetical protein AVEN_85416-1 [Araneus ventricosus]